MSLDASKCGKPERKLELLKNVTSWPSEDRKRGHNGVKLIGSLIV